ncbi:MAG: alkaline phosphatase family protein [Candidatus Nanohaloarchaea archaeon]
MDLIVLGVDGVDPRYLEKAMERYEMPNWERLKQEAFYTELPSTVPAVTVPAWVSMFSGYKPGKFEAYHLNDPDFDSWEMTFPDSSRFQGLFFWDCIDAEVGLHYVPGTSPVYPVNGWMRGGFPSPEDFEFYPEDLRKEFDDLEREHSHGYTTSSGKIKAELGNYETEREIADIIMEKAPDVFVSVIRMTDQVSHFAENESQVLECYRETEEAIGKVLDRAESEDAALIVVSDHGFMHADRKFNVLKYLENEGLASFEAESSPSLLYRLAEPLLDTPLKRYLKYAHDFFQSKTGMSLEPGADALASIEKSSSVLPYHFGLGRDCALKVHTQDMPHGHVDEDGKDDILARLEEKLSELERGGETVVEKVWRGEELYPGAENRPDIVFRTTPEFIADTAPASRIFSRTSSFTHDENGVFFALGPGIDEDAEEELEIYDVAPLIYALLDEPIPDDLDGTLPEKLVPDKKPEYTSTEIEDISI